MISVVNSSLSQEDVVDHPAKKARNFEGTYRSAVLEPPVNTTLTITNDSTTSVTAVTSKADEAGSELSNPSTDTHLDTQTALPEQVKDRIETGGKPIPETLQHQPASETVELAGSLDGWLRQNLNLPSLKLFKRNETATTDPHACSSSEIRPDAGFGSPIPGSPQWFRLQPPTSQNLRASPSIEIEILSPVVPEAYPEDDADMMTEFDECGTFGPMAQSPRCDYMQSPSPNTPRKRGLSRLGWGTSPLKESLVQCRAADAPFPSECDSKQCDATASPDDCRMQSPKPADNQENSVDARSSARFDGHDALEMQALEARFVQMLHAGGGCLPVAMALPLFRDYMFDEKDKDAVRGMLTRWCTVRDSPQGGERWLLMRSSFEQQGLQCPA